MRGTAFWPFHGIAGHTDPFRRFFVNRKAVRIIGRVGKIDILTFTGHENYETMKPYIAKTDKTRRKCMEDNFTVLGR